jgi:hypothetical protein
MPDQPTIYLRLDEAAFRELVAGRTTELWSQNGKHLVRVMLADIGWVRMVSAICDAQEAKQ